MIDDLEILIVDDRKTSSSIIKSTLQSHGYQNIRTASNGASALQELKKQPADVVLADWEMPEMTGLELTDRIRDLDEELNRYTAIVLLTGNEESDAILHAFERCVDDYVVKAADKRQLVARVYAAGRIAQMQNTLLETTQELTRTARSLMDKNITHPISGLPNRKAFEDFMDAAIREVTTRDGTISTVIFHIREFDQIETALGTEIGEDIILAIGRRVRRAVRPMDFVAHTGHDQFGVIMHFQNPIKFRRSVFERIISSLTQRPVKIESGFTEVEIDISVTASSSDGDIMTPQLLLKAADDKRSAT